MESKTLRTYVRKGRQKDAGCNAGTWNTVFDLPMNQSNGQQGCDAQLIKPAVNKNRQLRNRYFLLTFRQSCLIQVFCQFDLQVEKFSLT